MLKPLHIAILGTRGIPNHYGGFEQLAAYLSAGLVERGHRVTVYNVHHHPYQQSEWKGVQIVHVNDPERWLGTAAQFLYDRNCLRDAKERNVDVLLFLGYTSSSVWGRSYPKGKTIICNMDGLEWSRAKYSPLVQRFLKKAESWAVRYSPFLVADSTAIQAYLKDKYKRDSCFIPYGAELYPLAADTIPLSFGLSPGRYAMVLARMEPENNVGTVLEGFRDLKTGMQLVVVGDTVNRYGRYLKKTYQHLPGVHFIGAQYDPQTVEALRQHCCLYFHGHSAGGTNPSLLEAMASGCSIAAHDNVFNRAVLGSDGEYFRNAEQVRALFRQLPDAALTANRKAANREKITQVYNWPTVVEQYREFIESSVKKQRT